MGAKHVRHARYMGELGGRLARLRESRSWSRAMLAQEAEGRARSRVFPWPSAYVPTITGAYVARIETGERLPSLQVVWALSRALGVSSNQLLYGDEGGDAK